MTDLRFTSWLDALEERHLADLRFSEVTRALRALSTRYVQRRDRLTERGALDTAGKRAAYALYYSPLHFMTVGLIVDALDAARRPINTVLDLGCGAGAAGAAWGSRLSAPTVVGIDSHPWAITEAAWTYRAFGLDPDVRRGHAARVPLPRSAGAIVAGWMMNELDNGSRLTLCTQLLERARSGTDILIVEPIATRVTPWWTDWVPAFLAVGGRSDEWRFRVQLPDLLARLDRAAGLRHDELTARTLYVAAAVRRKKGNGQRETGNGPRRAATEMNP